MINKKRQRKNSAETTPQNTQSLLNNTGSSKPSFQQLLHRYSEGLDLARISRITGIHMNDLSREFRALNPEYVRTCRTWARSRRMALADYACGDSLAKVAETHGHCPAHWCVMFKRMHPDYRALVRRGVFASTAATIARSRNAEQREALKNWLVDNARHLLETEATTAHQSFSTAQLGEHRKSGKWRPILDNLRY